MMYSPIHLYSSVLHREVGYRINLFTHYLFTQKYIKSKMKTIKITTILTIFAISFLMVGCGPSNTDKIIGTYEFQIYIPNMDDVVTGYSYNGFSRERRQVGTITGVDYLVVNSNMEVIKIDPENFRTYIGEVDEVDDGVFTVKCSNGDGEFGNGYTLYRSGDEIGRAGNSYGGYDIFVVDTKTRRVYESISDYKNRDISDVEYIMYSNFSPNAKTSNTTGWKKDYFDSYRNRY